MILEISKKYRAEPFQNIYFGTDCPILHESLPHTNTDENKINEITDITNKHLEEINKKELEV